jgi:hypothetical protein
MIQPEAHNTSWAAHNAAPTDSALNSRKFTANPDLCPWKNPSSSRKRVSRWPLVWRWPDQTVRRREFECFALAEPPSQRSPFVCDSSAGWLSFEVSALRAESLAGESKSVSTLCRSR